MEEINQKTIDRAERLLMVAKRQTERIAHTDANHHTIFQVLGGERDEVHTHSRMLFYLFAQSSQIGTFMDFQTLFLQHLEIPDYAGGESWTAYRERCFRDGRLDFVFESEKYVIAIEMKIDAPDGEAQLERYENFCKSRKKEYWIYYLTPDGRMPEEYSMGKMKRDKLRCISFREHILGWLEDCLKITTQGGYLRSLIRQYMGTVKRITDVEEGEEKMEHLINDTETALAALYLKQDLKDKMSEVFVTFMTKLSDYIKQWTGLETRFLQENVEQFMYEKSNACSVMYPIIDIAAVGKKEYHFFFSLEVDGYIYAALGFENQDDAWEYLSDISNRAPKFYRKWAGAVEALNISNMSVSQYSYWFPLENTRGELFYPKEYSKSMLELIDQMDLQVEYIGDYLVNQVIRKLLRVKEMEEEKGV